MSYSTIAEADLIIFDNDWLALSDVEKQKFLDYATTKINLLPYTYENISHGNENKFPWTRQTKVPQQVKLACSKEAYGEYLASVGKLDKGLVNAKLGIKSESTLTASVTYADNQSNYASLPMFQTWNSSEAINLMYIFTCKTAINGRRVNTWDYQNIYGIAKIKLLYGF